MVRLLLHVAVRVTVTCPSQKLLHAIDAVPGHGIDCAGQLCAAASSAQSTTAETIASRTGGGYPLARP